ncbi:hypothetical protein ABTM30_19835, partial [Acinetobacter baumannii]
RGGEAGRQRASRAVRHTGWGQEYLAGLWSHLSRHGRHHRNGNVAAEQPHTCAIDQNQPGLFR